MRKQRIRLSIVALVAGLFFSHARVSAMEFTGYIDQLSADLYDKWTPVEVKTIIANYCQAALTSSPFTQNGFAYNAQQSAFVHLLCKNAANMPSVFFPDDYFTRSTFAQLWFQNIVDYNDLCTPMSNDCDLATYVPNLFNDIITDYVNIKQANIYGLVWNSTTDKNMEDQINEFSQMNFGLALCDTKTRSYPKTCAMMKWYFKNARNLLSDVRIFKPSVVLAAKNDSLNCTVKDDNYNIFLCGLYGDATATSMVSFVNLTYNELLYYRLFVGYYFLSLQKNPGTLLHNSQNTDINAIMKKFSSQYIRSKTALTLTFRMMRDTYMAFPFHVGFSMYKEDLDGFWKLLAKIATPIYTLYDKLRNVQKPQ